MGQVKLTNGLRKLKMADYTSSGIGEVYEVADLTAMSSETAESEVSLAAGNGILYSLKSTGKTTGTVSFYGMDDETEAKMFDVRKSKNGTGKIYGLRANKGYKVLIIEGTAVNPKTMIEEDTHIIFPRVSLGMLGDEGTTKDPDGNQTVPVKSLSFTALALDNKFRTYKYIGSGETPSTITLDMFDEAIE